MLLAARAPIRSPLAPKAHPAVFVSPLGFQHAVRTSGGLCRMGKWGDAMGRLTRFMFYHVSHTHGLESALSMNTCAVCCNMCMCVTVRVMHSCMVNQMYKRQRRHNHAAAPRHYRFASATVDVVRHMLMLALARLYLQVDCVTISGSVFVPVSGDVFCRKFEQGTPSRESHLCMNKRQETPISDKINIPMGGANDMIIVLA